jgi:tetratricopeptide (TPR) repeat protein
MSKSLVERYEQILGQDPTSTVFVELAKALLEKGDHARAIEVCQAGLVHHQGSVVGRVLWGKALINLGRPAEAMAQFDSAIGIDKENPYAYNLIGEVLLQKGLYRSALPLLRKAASLQPNDARIRQWLEQTQKALQGGPAPVVPDASAPDSLLARATETPPAAAEPPPPAPSPAEAPGAPERPAGGGGSGPELGAPQLSVAEPGGEPATPPARPREELLDIPPPPEPPPEASAARPPSPPPASALPSGSRPPPVPSPPPPVPRPSAQRKALLEDLPDLQPPAKEELPQVELSTAVTKQIADEYERELRQRLEQTAKQKSFAAKHGFKLAIGAVAVVAVAVGAGAFLYTRSMHRGRDLKDALASAKKAIAQDTPASYQEALASLGTAVQMDPDSEESWALTAYVHALRFAEQGGSAEDRQRAEAALGRKGVADGYPSIALAVRYYLADPKDARGRDEAKEAVLGSTLDEPELHELSGRILLGQKEPKAAVERFKKALELSAGNVRALVALATYYREFGDCPNAIKFYETAAQVSPLHPEGVVGSAECRLELDQELEKALKEVEGLPDKAELPPDLLARRELVHGRLLSAAGQHEAALRSLQEGAKSFRGRAYDFQMALGEASRASGALEPAQRAFEAALKLRPRDEAKDALGRVLLARDRERELLSRFAGDDSRRVALLRGIAHGKLGDWKRARAELARTQQGGKFPPEAVVQLALADAAEGQAAKAQEVLERALAGTRKARAEVQVALGQVYWKQGLVDRARAQFEGAMKDSRDYEGACALGRLHLQAGRQKEAVEALTRSVQRNASHAEAQRALGRTLLALGKVDEALTHLKAWAADSPGSGAAQLLLGLALYRAGQIQEADEATARAVKLDPSVAEAHRIRSAVLYARGDGPGALAALERANKLDSKDAETFCEIGFTFLRQGVPANAAKAFAAAVKNDPGSACGAIGAHLARLPATGRPAVKELQGLAQTAPSTWDRALAWATLARVQLQLGQPREARKSAEEAVGLAPFMAQAQLALGLAAARQKDDEAARAALTRASELDPTSGAPYLALGDLLARTDGEGAAAVTAYEAFLRMGGTDADTARAEKALDALKRKLASR